MSRFTWLINTALVLALLVITLGAYTRLTDAGLGCPDWPGCYGKLTAPLHEQHVAELQQQFPNAQIVPHKALNEMLHRYLAGVFGLTVLAIFVMSFIRKRFRKLASFILLLVIFQAALGMWTVTMNLLPLVVLGHLVGGFTLFSLLAILRAEIATETITEQSRLETEPKLRSLLPFGCAVALVLILQIMLGGWTSTNYAATVCYQLPFCEPGWSEHFSLQAAVAMPLGHETYEFGVLPYESRMSIHVLHRMGAIITFVALSFFIVSAWCKATSKTMRVLAVVIVGLLVLQVTLGLINIRAQLPLLNAVAHNLVAANLLMLLLVFVRQIYLRRVAFNETQKS
jgi:heme a synthase